MSYFKEVAVGIVGAGRAAELHLQALKHIGGCRARVKAIMAPRICQLEQKIAAFPFIESYSQSLCDLLADPQIDVIDICAPPYTHIDIAKAALAAGKHVICEKPLAGYFGEPGDRAPIGKNVPKAKMLAKTLAGMESLKEAIERSGKLFMYAENFLYTPAIQKAAEIIRARKSKILFMKGEESLRGSTSRVAGQWNKTGGGTLIRTGIHPLSAILWLKRLEGKISGSEIRLESVMCDATAIIPTLSEGERGHINARPEDVEDSAVLILNFSDKSKAVVIATDTLLGGSRNYVDIYCNNAALRCNITMHNAMECFLPDARGMETVEISEMLDTKTGWNNPFIADEYVRGYIPEMQDFMTCVAENRQPLAGMDIAVEVIRAIYAGYVAAEDGEKFYFSHYNNQYI